MAGAIMRIPTAVVSWARSQALRHAVLCAGVCLGLRGELRERVTDAHLALDRGVEQALGIRAELRIPDGRALREERLDELQLRAEHLAALQIAARGELLDDRGAARQVAFLLVDRDRVRRLLPPLDECGRGLLVLGRDGDREPLGETERGLRTAHAGHERSGRLAGDARLLGVVRGREVPRPGREYDRGLPGSELVERGGVVERHGARRDPALLDREGLPLERLVARGA